MGGQIATRDRADMSPLVLLPLFAAGCVAAPAAGVVALHGAVPLGGVVATHSVTHNVPTGVELKQVGETVPVAAPLAVAAVPGYSVDGEIRTASVSFPEPAPVEVDVKSLPVLGGVAPIAPLGIHAGPVLAVKAADEEEDAEGETIAVGHAFAPAFYNGVVGHAIAQAAIAPAAIAPAAIAPTVYTDAVAAVNPNVNLNIPAPIPDGAVGPQNVQTFKVKALGRPVVEYTPQVTKVVPELNIVERTYDVAVPKPVYQTKHITPQVTKHVPDPVPAPYAVPTIQHVGVAHQLGVHHGLVHH